MYPEPPISADRLHLRAIRHGCKFATRCSSISRRNDRLTRRAKLTAQHLPVEERPGISLATRRDVRVPDHLLNRVALAQYFHQIGKTFVLNSLEWQRVTALKLYPYRKIVTPLTPTPA